MCINEVLERTCEAYISKKFEDLIAAVSAAQGNTELISIAVEDFRSSVANSRLVLAEAKQIVEE
jgi:hypothetical protein